MADEKARAKAEKDAVRDEKARFAEWKKIQEDAGHTVEGTSMADARVIEIPDGPTHDDTPGA